MSFVKLDIYKCTKCGHKVTRFSIPSECPECIRLREEETKDKLARAIVIGPLEREQRYRIQYKLNGYKWNGNMPKAFHGDILTLNVSDARMLMEATKKDEENSGPKPTYT